MQALLLSVIAFISTNIDDLFINMLFFAQHRTQRAARSLTAGKYLGMGALTAISLLGAYGLQMLRGEWLALLGLIPIGLGIKEIISTLRGQNGTEEPSSSGKTLWLSMALITIANGADNIGVYLPLFSGFNFWQMGAAFLVFILMTGLWCLLSKRLTDWPALQRFLTRYRPLVIPLVYILLGCYILFF